MRTWLPPSLVEQELAFARRVQEWRNRSSYYNDVRKLLSTHPLHDASVVVYVVFAFSVPFVGYSLVACAALAFFIPFVIDKLVHAHTPRALDSRIVPLSHVSPGGFPCFELVMAAAVFLDIAAAFRTPGVYVCLGLLLSALLWLKVWSTSYFLYSMLGSVFIGATVAALVEVVGGRLSPHPHSVSREGKLGLALAAAAAAVGILAYRAENNAAPILRVPRSDFVRVLEMVHHGPDPSR